MLSTWQGLDGHPVYHKLTSTNQTGRQVGTHSLAEVSQEKLFSIEKSCSLLLLKKKKSSSIKRKLKFPYYYVAVA